MSDDTFDEKSLVTRYGTTKAGNIREYWLGDIASVMMCGVVYHKNDFSITKEDGELIIQFTSGDIRVQIGEYSHWCWEHRDEFGLEPF